MLATIQPVPQAAPTLAQVAPERPAAPRQKQDLASDAQPPQHAEPEALPSSSGAKKEKNQEPEDVL